MLTTEQENIISDALRPLFEYLETEIISDVARRVDKTMTYTRTAEIQVMEMRKLGYSPKKIRAEVMKLLRADKEYQHEVAKNTLEYKREIADLIADIVEKAKEGGSELLASAGNMAWVNDLSVWEAEGIALKEGGILDTLVKAYETRWVEELLNLTKSNGFKGIGGWQSVENLYRTELNKAIIKLTSGTFDRETVIRQCVKNLAKSGLRSIDYASGHTMQLDTATKLAVRTGAHQISGEIQKQNILDSGVYLVYIQEHEGARDKGIGIPNHKEWQGKVYSIVDGDYTAEAERIGQDKIVDLWEATGYSIDGKHEHNLLGLYGYNCRHIMNPWWEFASELPERIKEHPDVEYNGKTLDGYEQTQEMRKAEREIRSLKREKEALNKLGKSTYELNSTIETKTSQYHNMCDMFGYNPQDYNLTYTPGTSDYRNTDAWKRYQKEIIEAIGNKNV